MTTGEAMVFVALVVVAEIPWFSAEAFIGINCFQFAGTLEVFAHSNRKGDGPTRDREGSLPCAAMAPVRRLKITPKAPGIFTGR